MPAASASDTQPLLALVRALARPTDSCVSTSTLLAAGITKPRIQTLHAHGAITSVVRGVYAVGLDALSFRQARRIVQLAAGTGSELTGRTGAEQRRLLPESDHRFEATVFSKRNNRDLTTALPLEATGLPALLRIRSSRWELEPDTSTSMPTASVARLLLSLAANEGGEIVHAAWREADFLGILDPAAADRLCRRGVAGSTTLRRLTDAMPTVRVPGTEPMMTEEALLIEALMRRGLPRPLANAPLRLDDSWYFPDVHFVKWGVVIEADGGVHYTPLRQAEDRARDAHMRRHNLHVMRADRDEIRRSPDQQADIVIRRLLSLGIALPGVTF